MPYSISFVRHSERSEESLPMLSGDLYNFFRWWLGWVVTVYATIIMLQSIWSWYVWLKGSDKYTSLLRRYIVVQTLRLRFKTFWGDAIICVLLCVAFGLLWKAQIVMGQIEQTAQETRQLSAEMKHQTSIHVTRP